MRWDVLERIITVIGIVIAVIEFAISIRNNSDNKKHDKRQATLEAYRELQRDVFDELCVKYTEDRIREVAEHFRTAGNVEDYHILGTYTAKIEHFCVGVVYDIYDWETVYELSHGFLDGKVRQWLARLMERKAEFYGEDPFENTKKVFELMDRETAKRKHTKAKAK